MIWDLHGEVDEVRLQCVSKVFKHLEPKSRKKGIFFLAM